MEVVGVTAVARLRGGVLTPISAGAAAFVLAGVVGAETLRWAAVVAVAVLVGAEKVRGRSSGPTGVEAAHAAYVEGRIDEDELERRVALAIDEDRQQVREVVERVNGVGPATSRAVALRYPTVGRLQEATVEDLRGVPNVGDERAAAMVERVEN